MRRWSTFFITMFSGMIVVLSVSGQEILTAEKYLAQVAETYSGIKDYSAKITVSTGKTDMYGTIIYKNPNLVRIDFTKPEEQVIAYNGETLTVYLPEYRAVLSQTTSASGGTSGAGLASAQGLGLLRRNYNSAYTTSPDPVPLDQGSLELVIKLTLTRRTVSEGFRELKISIHPETKLIRRIEGVTLAGETIIFNFTDIKLNQGIGESRFAYDSPASANVYNNFLFKESE
ncbi:LolA family protein [Gracilinema caldarium]|uniref:Outer membrane lipoprotein carrier protein LolA n=1 Tax=Gracilinema caldarium (strain ATCC 51460 / DSM 7334 / H1) TaxID=744872 RepID=F8EYP7_GRAC1|nr:outer membrane lipoprotein carrier protein LolA [Gracilinema caldarium]AEJ18624.1 outer membrane lipoprotein carrier protein LolA [Gracilinema caldarium DSM 7334]